MKNFVTSETNYSILNKEGSLGVRVFRDQYDEYDCHYELSDNILKITTWPEESYALKHKKLAEQKLNIPLFVKKNIYTRKFEIVD